MSIISMGPVHSSTSECPIVYNGAFSIRYRVTKTQTGWILGWIGEVDFWHLHW
jgi:hypothetical protein